MESEARYAWVGAAIVVLLAALAGGLLWLQGGLADRDLKRYTIYFRQHSLDGLQLNSDVKMYGIKVGKVLDYEILTSEAKNVRVVIEVDGKTPVLEGAEATISRNLVTGIAAIELENAREGAPPLMRKPAGERYPVLAEGPPRLALITANLEQIAERGNETLLRLNQTLSDENQQALTRTLTHLETVSGALARRTPEIEQTLVAVQETARQLQGLGTEAAQAMQHVNGQLERLGGQAEAMLEETRRVARSLEREVGDTAAHLRTASDIGAQELQAAGRAVTGASENVSDAALTLQGAAGALVRPASDNLGPGEAKP